MKKAIRHLIIGRNVYIESANEFKQVMLSVQYALIALVVLIIYGVIDLINGIHETSVIFAGTAIIIFAALVLHRHRFHCFANYLLFPTFNVAVFLIASSETLATGKKNIHEPVARVSLEAIRNTATLKVGKRR